MSFKMRFYTIGLFSIITLIQKNRSVTVELLNMVTQSAIIFVKPALEMITTDRYSIESDITEERNI